MGGLDFSKLRHLVLDEADRMLDMGFFDDLIRIVSELPKDRQTLCFSATMPPKIRTLTATILRNPEQINIAISQPAAGIRQLAYLAHDEQKHKLVQQILKDGAYKSAIIFSSSKEKVKKVEAELRRAGVNIRAFHSDLDQDARESLMLDFKSRKVPVLVGTDVLSRGIDVEGIELVLNYDVPPDPEDYVHRIGRTARAERTGTAITFVNDKDMRRFGFIEKLINREVEQVPLPEGFGPGPEYKKEGGGRSHSGGGKSGSAKKRKFKPGGGGGKKPPAGKGV
jgi:superfamily II DNA/RNA helicase